MQDQRKNINENYKEEQNKQKETNFSSLKPKEEQNPQTTLTAKEIKKRILRSLDNGELDEEAIEALKTLNHQNRANLTEEEKNQLDKELVDRELHTYGSKRYILEKVIDLLAKGADVNAQDDIGRTALHYAAYYNCTKIAELLLKYGADPNAQIEEGNWEGWTALHLATKKNNPKIAELLLKYGADITIPDEKGNTAFVYAAFNGNMKIADLLISKAKDKIIDYNNKLHLSYLLFYYAYKGDIQEVESLIDKGADVNAEYKDETLLIHAAKEGYTKAAEILLKYGANPNLQSQNKDWEGRTALHFAAFYNYTNLAELLLKHGADSNAQDKYGQTALHIAAFHNHPEIVELLLKYGANPDIQIEKGDDKGWTALHIAAYYNYPKLAELLLTHGANIFIIDYSGKTALTKAIYKGNKRVINLLLTKLFQMGFNIDKPLDEIDGSTKNIAITLKNECNEKIASSIKQRIEQ